MEYYKELTRDMPIKDGPEADELIFAVSQHLGNPSQVIVKVGDTVKVGQLLAEAVGEKSARIHSSVSGKVVKIDSFPHPLGESVLSVFVENDHLYEVSQDVKPRANLDIESITDEEIRKMVHETGIVGLGGATCPTQVKLIHAKEKEVDSIILNAAECEPYLTCDERLLREEVGLVLMGLKLAAKASGAQKIYIAIEDNKPEAINELRKVYLEYLPKAEIVILKTEYPKGAERILINDVLDRRYPPLTLPIDSGVVVINVGTAWQIGKTFESGMPLISRIVTFSGKEMKKKGNYRVRLGTPIKAFFTDEDQDDDGYLKLILGGPMMGLAQYTLNVPIIKGTSGVLLIEDKMEEEKNCIRCASCVDYCPVDLLPLIISLDVVPKVQECMECGLCSYYCPAKIPLVQKIKVNKYKYMEIQRKADRS